MRLQIGLFSLKKVNKQYENVIYRTKLFINRYYGLSKLEVQHLQRLTQHALRRQGGYITGMKRSSKEMFENVYIDDTDGRFIENGKNWQRLERPWALWSLLR